MFVKNIPQKQESISQSYSEKKLEKIRIFPRKKRQIRTINRLLKQNNKKCQNKIIIYIQKI